VFALTLGVVYFPSNIAQSPPAPSFRAHDHLHAELTRLRVRRLNIISIECSYVVRRIHALFRYRGITSKDAGAVA
jgi:hypothetical protein